MVMMAKRSVLMALCLVLSSIACIANAADTATVPRSLKVDPAESGLLIGSIGAKVGSPFQSYSIFFGPASEKKAKGRLFFQDGAFLGTKPNYAENGIQYAVFQLRLPPGDYLIRDVQFFQNLGTVQKTINARAPFAVPFRIEKGKATYIGRFGGHGILAGYGKIFVVPVAGYFIVDDGYAMDREFLKKMLPESDLAPENVVSSIIPTAALDLPYFRPPGYSPDAPDAPAVPAPASGVSDAVGADASPVSAAPAGATSAAPAH